MDRVIRKRSSPITKVPGPDGFRLTLWKRVSGEFLEWIRQLFNLCLSSGKFPASWKAANLVLIPKSGGDWKASLSSVA